MTLEQVSLWGGSAVEYGWGTEMVTGRNINFSVKVGHYHASSGAGVTRLRVKLSEDPHFATSSSYFGPWRPNGYSCTTGVCESVALTSPLPSNRKYYVAAFIEYQSDGRLTDSTTASFFTDRPPDEPTLVTPEDDEFITGSVTFNVIQNDVDNIGPLPAQLWVRYRTAQTPLLDPGPWITVSDTLTTTIVQPSSAFESNVQYEWSAQTSDSAGLISPWAESRFFWVLGGATPPILLNPAQNEAIWLDRPYTFSWQFRDANQSSFQDGVDFRYRLYGDTEWTYLSVPPNDEELTVPALTFPTGHYEWQVQTFNADGDASGYTGSGSFWAVDVGQDSGPYIPEVSEVQHSLGQGNNRVYVYERGGHRRLGELKPLSSVQWSRKRDDISNALITCSGFGDDNGQLLASLRSWRHEIVIIRDNKRVWEGPVTRVSYYTDHVEIEAKDVMAYVYRRIMRQGYNDSYRVINGVQVGLKSVVVRARAIIMNALSYDDPNVLRYLTALENLGDARNSRIVPPYSKTAWGEVDDLAATAGLDYTTVGRRIMLWDTHRQIGQLPEMSDGDFSDSPVVSEYGMSAANVFAVTNNNGVYGVVARVATPFTSSPHVTPPPEGYLEQLASAYGESAGGATDETLTAEALAALKQTLYDQASRNINGRWPVPVLVRVPDNTSLNPELNLGINQLIPGVWIPLRAVGTLRKVTQMQKLDSVQVNQDAAGGERVTIIMSPAPVEGTDPDLDAAEADDS